MKHSSSLRVDNLTLLISVAVALGACNQAFGWQPLLDRPASLSGELLSVHVIPDGSSEPPGDLVHVLALVVPENKNAVLQVKPYLVSPDGQAIAITQKDADRALVMRKSFSELKPDPNFGTPEAFKVYSANFVAPYSEMNVTPGTHLIGYITELMAGDRIIDTNISRLTTLTVDDSTREEITTNKVGYAIKEVPATGSIVSHDGEITPLKWQENVPRFTVVPGSKITTASINGSFKRTKAPMGAPVPSGFYKDPSATQKTVVGFATSRRASNLSASPYFGRESILDTNKLTYGTCTVNLPLSIHHKKGVIEKPKDGSWIPWQRKEEFDRKQHFKVEGVTTAGRAKLVESIGDRDVLVFVHGFNNSFEDAIERSAQLALDLEFDDRHPKVCAFSWPSAGQPVLTSATSYFDIPNLSYDDDSKAAKEAAPFLAFFLYNLAHECDGKVHVIAHSMGNRVLLEAVHFIRVSEQYKERPVRLGNVIMAAADVDFKFYSETNLSLFQSCERVTYYYSSTDRALALSARRNGKDKSPIGLSAIFGDPRLDTICAEELTETFGNFKHLYFGETESVLTDIQKLLLEDALPQSRLPPLQGYRTGDKYGQKYWYFYPR